MGRHSASEGRHRQSGALLAQLSLVVVLVLVAVAVLIGSLAARDQTVSGTFADAETAEQAVPGTSTPAPTLGPSATAPGPDSSGRVDAPDDRGVDASPAPSTPTAKEDERVSPDTTAAPTSRRPRTTLCFPPTRQREG